MKLKTQRRIAIFLACILFFSWTFHAMPYAEGSSNLRTSKTVDGITYKMTRTNTNGKTKLVIIKSDEPNNKGILYLNNKKNVVTATKYKYLRKNSLEKKQYKIVTSKYSVAKDVVALPNDTIQCLNLSYGDQTYEYRHKKYFYCYGNHGKKLYLKIGGKGTYQIAIDNLSKTNQTKVNQYVNYIRNCNSNMQLAVGTLTVGGICVTIALLAIGIVAPEAIISALATSGITGLGFATTAVAAVKAFIRAQNYYTKITDQYVIIRRFGNKI